MAARRFLLCLVLYVVAARLCLEWKAVRARVALFALINLLGVLAAMFNPWTAADVPPALGYFAVYVAWVGLQFLALDRFAEQIGWRPWIAFFTPLAGLVIVKYAAPLFSLVSKNKSIIAGEFFIGISYLTFRASRLVLEVRNGLVRKPGFWEYLSFCFFAPTMSVGPINSYSTFQKGFMGPDRAELPLGRSGLRILVGIVKYVFLAHVCNQFSYNGLMLDGHPHRPMELIVAAVFYYLFLYCNFSGLCDMAIGLAGILGFPVDENFRDPFHARNLQDFWNRWHITLSHYMRDVVFTPLSKWLVGWWGTARINAAIAVSVFVVFLLIGIWHGVGWNYAAFGAAHGIGLVAVHYYGVGLKKWLGKEGYRRYLQSAWIHALAVCLTFAYVAACLFLFANDGPEMRRIFAAIRH